MLDTDFLSLCFIASLAYYGDVHAACEAAQWFASTRHVNPANLERILRRGFDLHERTNAWVVGSRYLSVEMYRLEVAKSGKAHSDIRHRWSRPVLIRRASL
jgi:hypothetical protein